MSKSKFIAGATLMGSVIGAGIFGLPYALKQGGWLLFLLVFAVFSISVLVSLILFSEISLRSTREYFVGYAEEYLHPVVAKFVKIYTPLGLIGTLLAYIIMGGTLLSVLLAPIANISPIYLGVVFALIGGYFVFRKSSIGSLEFILTSVLVLALLIVIGVSLPRFGMEGINLAHSNYIFLLPGVILFSLLGWNAVPSMIRILRKGKETRKLGKVITISMIVIMLIYFLFALSFVGVNGGLRDWAQLTRLVPSLGLALVTLLAAGGVLASITSFLGVGMYFKNILKYDYQLSSRTALLIVLLVPLLLFVFTIDRFIGVVGLVGAFMGGLQGIIVTLIFKQARKEDVGQPEYTFNIPAFLLNVLIGIFIVGVFSQFLAYL